MPTTHGRLSDATIGKLPPGATLRDTEVRGLYVRRNQDDSATYYLTQRAHSGANAAAVKLGRWQKNDKGISPKDARAIANKRKAAKTLHEEDGHFRFPRLRDFIIDVYYPQLAARCRISPKLKGHLAASSNDTYRQTLDSYVLDAVVQRCKLGDMRLDQIDRTALLGLHASVLAGNKKRARETTADQAVTFLTVALGHAEVVYARHNYRRPPMRDFPFLKRGYKREVYATVDQMGAFRKELNRRLTGTRPMARPGPKPRGENNDLLLIAALWVTGQRSGAVRRLRWEQRQQVTNGDAFVIPPQDGIKKKRGETMVPVTPELQAILDRVTRYPGSPWVFSRPADTGGVYRVPPLNRVLYAAIKGTAGCEHLRPHDVRRSVGVLARLDGMSRDDVQDVFQHADARTTEIYTPAAPTLLAAARRVAAAIGSFIDPQRGPTPPSNVVRMTKRA